MFILTMGDLGGCQKIVPMCSNYHAPSPVEQHGHAILSTQNSGSLKKKNSTRAQPFLARQRECRTARSSHVVKHVVDGARFDEHFDKKSKCRLDLMVHAHRKCNPRQNWSAHM